MPGYVVTTLAEILVRDPTRPLAIVLAVQTLGWAALLWTEPGPRALVGPGWVALGALALVLGGLGQLAGLFWRPTARAHGLRRGALWGTVATGAALLTAVGVTDLAAVAFLYLPALLSVALIAVRVRPPRPP